MLIRADGEWISEVIDDKLYLIKEDFGDSTFERVQFLELSNRKDPQEEYRAIMQTGSQALYFAQCSDANETWLPLLEKAYAKAHGDYAAINGGFVGLVCSVILYQTSAYNRTGKASKILLEASLQNCSLPTSWTRTSSGGKSF